MTATDELRKMAWRGLHRHPSSTNDDVYTRETRDHIKCGYCGLNIESVLQLRGCNEHAIKFCPNCGRKVEP